GGAGDLPAGGQEAGPFLCAAAAALLLPAALAPPGALAARGREWSRWRLGGALAGAVALALALGLLASVRPLRPSPGTYWLVALDVGQGDALALGFRDAWWLVDCGPRTPRQDAGERVVLPFLRWAGVRRLAGVALTHDDSDHTGGARAVGRGIPVGRWWTAPALPGARRPATPGAAATAARGDTLHRDPLVIV